MNIRETFGFKGISACLLGAALWLLAGAAGANASQIEIVAVGDSNTAGWGVGESAAYPAQLQSMLRAKGYDANVVNAGISGDTSGMILNRLDSVIPAGAKVVILQMSHFNDSYRGVSEAQTEVNIKAAVARVHARGAKIVFVSSATFAAIPRADYQYDGLHLSEAGHALMASRLLPQVLAAIGHGTSRTASAAH